MPSRYHESLWEAIPARSQPADLQLRLAFALTRLRGASERAGSGSPPLRVLDVGCGEAQITAELARGGFRVVGVGIAEAPLPPARREPPDLDVRLIDERDWPLDDASFDAVFSGETVEHVLDTICWLSGGRPVRRPRGRLVLSKPARR